MDWMKFLNKDSFATISKVLGSVEQVKPLVTGAFTGWLNEGEGSLEKIVNSLTPERAKLLGKLLANKIENNE